MSCSGALKGGRVPRRFPRRGSKEGLLRRHLEDRNTPYHSTCNSETKSEMCVVKWRCS